METIDPFHLPATTQVHQIEVIQTITRRGGQAAIVYLVAQPLPSTLRRRWLRWRIKVVGINQRTTRKYQLGAMKIAKTTARDDILDEASFLKRNQNASPHLAREYYSFFGSTVRASIIPITDAAGEEHIYRFVTFVYEAGGTLLELIQQRHCRPFTPAQAVQIVHQLALALGALHSKQIVYNDLSPSNIMFRERLSPWRATKPFVVLIDFGASEETTQQFFRQVLGKRPYLPPERRRGLNPMNIDGDTYSLGVVLYELLAGKIDLHSQSMAELMNRKRMLAQTPPETPTPLSAALNSLVLDAITFDVQERSAKIPTMEDFRSRLEALPEYRQSGALRAPLTRAAITLALAGVLLLALLAFGAIQAVVPTAVAKPTPTTLPTITPIPSATRPPTATSLPSQTPTVRPTVTLIPTSTREPVRTPTAAATATP